MQKQFIGMAITILLCCNSVFSQNEATMTVLSPSIANYDIEVELDVANKMLRAKEQLFWKNPSSDTIRELQFHLYYNAFKNSESTFMQERGLGLLMTEDKQNACDWGWSSIDQMEDQYGNDLTPYMQYIQPDDGNEYDQTVLNVRLVKAVMPHDSIRIMLDFSAKIPKAMARTGYSEDYFFFVQWFPKVGVYEAAGTRYAKKGQWNCHQYHAYTEYYADFGVYNVSMTVPKNYILGASGVLKNVEENGNTTTYTYRAQDVIDFAWTAYPGFVEVKDQWQGVNIRLLTNADHTYMANRYINAAKYALEYLDKYIGKYPYPSLTIVDPPLNGSFSVGMEYPTLITTGTLYAFPETALMLETFTVHEFVHQYFMQMVATNEMEESWLDEGFTTYWEGRIMSEYYGEKTSTFDYLGIQVGNKEGYRISYLGTDNPQIAPNSAPAYQVPYSSFRDMAYNKTATWLSTLEGLLGLETMDEIMQTYFQRWKFKHPNGKDFIDVVNEVVFKNHGHRFGENMNWFFEQVVEGTGLCDYQLAAIHNIAIKKGVGIFEDKDHCIRPKDLEEPETEVYKSEVIVYRLGEVQLPIDILVHFENGDEKWETWDGIDRAITFEYQTSSKVDWAIIDPEQKIFMDKNFNNNSLTLQPNKTPLHKYVVAFLEILQNALQTVAWLI